MANSNAQTPLKKANTSQIVKVIIFAILLVVTTFFYALVCRDFEKNFSAIFVPSLDAIFLSLRIWCMVGMLVIVAGLVVALVRPFWIIALNFLAAALVLVLSCGLDIWSLVFGLVFFVLSLIFAESVVTELKNRIHFSVRPIWHAQKTLIFCLILLISVSFGLGCYEDVQKRNSIIPEQYKQMITDVVISGAFSQIQNQMMGQVTGQFGELGTEQQKELETSMNQEMEKAKTEMVGSVEKSISDIENTLRPYMAWVAFGLGLLLFFSLEFFFSLIGWTFPLILSLLILILKVMGVAREVKEMKETVRLEL